MPPGSGFGHTPGFSFFRGHSMPDRAIVFIDGNNWYHGLKTGGVADLLRLDYAKISSKLTGHRLWVGTRYYIGRVPQTEDVSLYAAQRHFLAKLVATDSRITTHLGRLEQRRVESPASRELHSYLVNLRQRIDRGVFQDLMQIARNHRGGFVMVEKAVDVMLAVDLVVMAERNEFDAAYILSADGDFTPAVQAVRAHGKKVYAVSTLPGAQLASVVNSFVRLPAVWFDDCYG